MFHKILVAVDNLTFDQPIFDGALELAKTMSACLMIVHVLSPEDKYNLTTSHAFVPYYYPILTDEVIQKYREEWEAAEQQGLTMLRSLASTARAAEVEVEFTQNLGHAGRVICQMAREWGADLIVTGRRGRSGFNELFLGSVSNYVLHHAPCAVLTLQGQGIALTPTPNVDNVVTTGI
jgi:nucleotide-binding universal stress UspA family protein